MVVVRAADERDIGAITSIVNQGVATTTNEWSEVPHTTAERAEWLAHQRAAGNPVLVAVDADAIVGWASYGDFRDTQRWPGYRVTVEHSVHVAETHWKRGVGRALLASLTEAARVAGKRVMVAAIDSANTGSIAFHERLGFRHVGYLPGVGEKWRRRLDLVLMQRDVQ